MNHHKPRLWFDPNASWDEERYVLNCKGTEDDLQKLRIRLSSGMEVTLYTEDIELDGREVYLLVDAVVEEVAPAAYVARVRLGTWRTEARTPTS